MQFYKNYSLYNKRALGFGCVYAERDYMPIPLKIRVVKPIKLVDIASKARTISKTDGFVERYVMSGCYGYDFNYHLFIKDDESFDARYLIADLDAVQILFEAEKFFYLMEHASKTNKLNLFRRAVIADEAEANDFLVMVWNSSLSYKDKNRAQTWTSKLLRHRMI